MRMASNDTEVNAPFSDAEREALYRVMRSRRDIRRFRPDPLPGAVLQRILEMAHLAPSVGFMQPWNFILISSVAIREQVKAVRSEEHTSELQSRQYLVCR